jgi:hypothetical protein
VGRRDHQGAGVAFPVHHGGRGDGHHGLAGAHLGIDDGGGLVLVHQQPGDGLDDLPLGRKRLAQEALHDRFPARIGLAGIDGGVLGLHRIQQAVTEFLDEAGQGQVAVLRVEGIDDADFTVDLRHGFSLK